MGLAGLAGLAELAGLPRKGWAGWRAARCEVRWRAVGVKEGLLGLRHVLNAVNTRVDQLEVLLLELKVLLLELEILLLEVLLLERVRLFHQRRARSLVRLHEYLVGAAMQLVSLLLPSPSLLRQCMHLHRARRVPRVTRSARQGAFGPAT